MMKIWLNLLTRDSCRGFTLLELLIASVLSFFVVSATGFAILVMTRQSLVNDVSSDLTFNISRASDFITSEVQQAKDVVASPIPSVLPSDCPTPAADEFVMGLVADTPAEPNATTNPTIIYYTKTPPTEDIWRGPSSIYRCGPPLGSDGNLTSGTNKPDILVDSVSSTTPSPEPCPSGTTRFPTTPTTGFYICQDDNNSKLIEIHITGTSQDLADRGLTGSGNSAKSGTYKVETKVFARSATP